MQAPSATASENARGALLMVASMAAFVCNDAFMKAIFDEVPIFQAVLVRGMFATALIWALLAFRGEARFSAVSGPDRIRIALRSAGELGATICFLTALAAMQLANVTAILLAAPLVLTMIGSVFLSEPVGWRRWSAVVVGFVGVMLIVQPGGSAFNSAAIWAVGAVFFVCLRDLVTRRLAPTTPSLLVSFATAVSIAATGGVVTLWQGWAPMPASVWLQLGVAALLVILGYLFSVMTMRVGDIGFVSPFRYTNLVFALILGYLVFGDAPNALALTGAALVTLAGVYTFHRERKRGR